MTTPKKKKRTWSDTGSHGKTLLTPQKKRKSVAGLSAKDKAIEYLNQYKYKQAFVSLLQDSERAKEEFLSVVSDMIKNEVNTC